MTQTHEYRAIAVRDLDELRQEITRWPTLGYRVVAITSDNVGYTIIFERPTEN